LDIQAQLGRFPREIELTLFRIMQEALTNIYRHSGSGTAEIVLSRVEDEVMLRVSDNGRGLPIELLSKRASPRACVGVGIAGMRERVRQQKGTLEIDSSSRGTCIKVALPINPAAPEENTSHEAVYAS